MTRETVRTAQRDEIFFTAIENCHSVTTASAAAGYSKAVVYLWRKENAEFRQRWQDAKTICADLLEEEADRRGRDGIDQPIFFRGTQVGSKQKFSDALLLARLKAERPEKYRESAFSPPPVQQNLTIKIRDFDQEDLLLRMVAEGKLAKDELPPELQRRAERREQGIID